MLPPWLILLLVSAAFAWALWRLVFAPRHRRHGLPSHPTTMTTTTTSSPTAAASLSPTDWHLSEHLSGVLPREHILEVSDGCRLHMLEFSLPDERQNKAVVICGHAFMVHHATLARADRPSVAGTLLSRGYAVLCLDIRGRRHSRHDARYVQRLTGDKNVHREHGNGGGGARSEHVDVCTVHKSEESENVVYHHHPPAYSYDNCLADTEAVIRFARRLFPRLPVYLLGHSLFSHQALAYSGVAALRLAEAEAAPHLISRQDMQALREANPDGIIALATGVWLPSLMTWREYLRSLLHANLLRVLSSWFRRIPARLLGFGSVDEEAQLAAAFVNFWKDDRWGPSRPVLRRRPSGAGNGDDDDADAAVAAGTCFRENMRHIQCPMLFVFSERDDTITVRYGMRFLSPLLDENRDHVSLVVLEPGSPHCPQNLRDVQPPTHMGLTTNPKSVYVWQHIADWLDQHVVVQPAVDARK